MQRHTIHSKSLAGWVALVAAIVALLLLFVIQSGAAPPELPAFAETTSQGGFAAADSAPDLTPIERVAVVIGPENGAVEDAQGDAPSPPRRVPNAATLELRILSGNSDSWFAAVLADQPAFVDDSGPTWSATLETGGPRSFNVDESGKGIVAFTGNAVGIYTFTNVRPGIEFQVAALDEFDLPIARQTVGPLFRGERRVVGLVVGSTPIEVRGRVLSQTGEPIAGAVVSLSELGHAKVQGRLTDGEGRFVLPCVGANKLVLTVAAPGFAPLFDTRFEVNADPTELVLERGRSVRIEVATPNFKPVSGVSIIGRPPGVVLPYAAYGRTDENGRCTLDNVPTAELPLEVRVAGRTFRSTLRAGASVHRIVIPAWQSIRVRVIGSRRGDGPPTERVELRPVPPSDGDSQSTWIAPSADRVNFERVFPGRYEVVLERYEDAKMTKLLWTRASSVVEVTEAAPGEAVLFR